MLLVVDVGNTNFTFGVFDGDKLEATFRVTTIHSLAIFDACDLGWHI